MVKISDKTNRIGYFGIMINISYVTQIELSTIYFREMSRNKEEISVLANRKIYIFI